MKLTLIFPIEHISNINNTEYLANVDLTANIIAVALNAEPHSF